MKCAIQHNSVIAKKIFALTQTNIRIDKEGMKKNGLIFKLLT
ncbi:hypothetical protein [Brumimicrobium aurantiacum]|nr:hypothetical protein [Brumimicrobium aurantiacum]